MSYFKISTNGGSSFSGAYSLASWNTTYIPYHCGRGAYFIGEFRHSNGPFSRAYYSFQAGGTPFSPYFYANGWVNQWNLTN